MKRLVYTLNMLYVFSLSLWVGGMFLLGLLVEIIIRVKLKEHPVMASKVINPIMEIFNIHIIIYTCITVIVVAELVKFWSKGRVPAVLPQQLQNADSQKKFAWES